MSSERDRDLVEDIRRGAVNGVVVAEEVDGVAAVVSQDPATVLVELADLPAAVAAARVRVAELVVGRARQAEGEPDVATRAAGDGDEDGRVADREAVRFALVILLLVLPAGVAVYLADGLLLAPAAPAAALLVLGVLVLVHRRPDDRPPAHAAGVAAPAPAPDVERTPAVRAAQAHLRRQEAAWKVCWWERDQAVPDLDACGVPLPATVPITLVAVDVAGAVDAMIATMTATAPAAVRVVVLQAR